MTGSEVKALIAGLVVVSGAAAGAVLWRQQHPEALDIAKLISPAPAAKPPIVPKPTPAPAVMPKIATSTTVVPAAAVPKTADLGIAPARPKPEPAAGRGEPPHFDVVRVEPNGEAVLAGKGDPNARIELLASGRPVAETKADPNGHFVILPQALTPGNHDLTLRQTDPGKAAEDSKQSIAVSVPVKSGDKVVVAMAEPGQPTKLISGPPEAPAAPKPVVAAPPASPAAVVKPQTALAPPPAIKAAAPALAIRSVELENGTGFFASGAAAPGTTVQIYLNGAHLASVVAGSDSQWSVTLKKGLKGGHYAVRADAGDKSTGVTARVEVPFDIPVAMAQAPTPAETAPEPPVTVAAAPETAPEPPHAPNPSEVPGLGPEPKPTEAAAQAPKEPPPRADVTAKAPAVAVPPARPPVVVPTPASRPQASRPEVAGAPAANAVIEQVETALVIPGDNLWNISRARLGHGVRFTEVYAANVSQIRDPRLIYPGQVFVVPPR